MTDLSSLIEKLEAAGEGGADLDAEIFLALTPDAYGADILRREGLNSDSIIRGRGGASYQYPQGGGCSFPIPEVTHSLDAAIKLVERKLPGWTWGLNGYDPEGGVDIGGQRDFRQPHAVVYGPSVMTKGMFGEPDDWDRPGHEAHAPTPALALCLSLLKALQAAPSIQEGTK